jgi:hypothetical protein
MIFMLTTARQKGLSLQWPTSRRRFRLLLHCRAAAASLASSTTGKTRESANASLKRPRWQRMDTALCLSPFCLTSYPFWQAFVFTS